MEEQFFSGLIKKYLDKDDIMISDETFDILFPIGYWYESYINQPPKRGKWKLLGMRYFITYVFERIG